MFTFVRIITCDCHVVTTSVKSWSCEPIAAIGGGGGAWQPMYRNQDGWGYLQCWWLEEEKGGALGLRLGRFRMMMCWPGHRCSSSPWWGTWWDHSTGSHLQCFTISAGYDPNYSHRTISPGLLADLIKLWRIILSTCRGLVESKEAPARAVAYRQGSFGADWLAQLF